MSLLDDDLIDKIDIYLLKNRLIDYLKIHSWYGNLTNPNFLPIQSCFYYTTESGRSELKQVIHHSYKISIINNSDLKLIIPKDFRLTLVLDYDEEVPDFVLDCIKDCKLNIVRGRIYEHFGHES